MQLGVGTGGYQSIDSRGGYQRRIRLIKMCHKVPITRVRIVKTPSERVTVSPLLRNLDQYVN